MPGKVKDQVRSLPRQKPSFDSVQKDDVTLSGVEVLLTLKFLCIEIAVTTQSVVTSNDDKVN